jgi:sortase A
MPGRSRQSADDQDALELLQQLIESPPSVAERWSGPVALRSREEQRRHALRRYLLRNWVDHTLTHAERLLAVAALVVFGLWFLDGPARDWLHERSAQGQAGAASAAPEMVAPAPQSTSATPAPEAPRPAGVGGLAAAVPLPYITSEMAADDAPEATPEPPGGGAAGKPEAGVLAPKVDPEPTRLLIPAIGVDTPVREVFVRDGAWEVAEYAAGYLNGTALPGEAGNTALAGHAGLRGAVFRDLGALVPGNEIFVDAGGKRYRYVVREARAVWPTEVAVLDPTPTAVLTMITCTNWDTQRLVVVADLVDAQPAT